MHDNEELKPGILNFDHIAIEVNDIDQAFEFYTGILGFSEMATPDEIKSNGLRWLYMNSSQTLHLVENKKTNPGKIAHIAFSVKNVAEWKGILTEKGVEIYPPKLNLYNAERFFIFDPSGNRIELVKWIR